MQAARHLSPSTLLEASWPFVPCSAVSVRNLSRSNPHQRGTKTPRRVIAAGGLAKEPGADLTPPRHRPATGGSPRSDAALRSASSAWNLVHAHAAHSSRAPDAPSAMHHSSTVPTAHARPPSHQHWRQHKPPARMFNAAAARQPPAHPWSASTRQRSATATAPSQQSKLAYTAPGDRLPTRDAAAIGLFPSQALSAIGG